MALVQQLLGHRTWEVTRWYVQLAVLWCWYAFMLWSLIFIVSTSSLIEFVVNWVSVNYMEME